MAKRKFYVVWSGRHEGVFETWDECKRNVEGYPNPKYKSFDSYDEAVRAFNNDSKIYIKRTTASTIASKSSASIGGKPVKGGLAVDAACSGNPGLMEYRGVELSTGKTIFHKGPFEDGTNNIGEFLAIVHALALLKKNNSDYAIYSDSLTAISWVRKKKANTKLATTHRNAALFDLMERAEKWLKQNTFSTAIIKWETEKWGEIPADFGRK